VQLAVWSISLAMFKFEYKRALGHIWYMHPLLWAYTSLYYLAEMYLQTKNATNVEIFKPYYILLACQALVAIVLTALVLWFQQDSPHRQHSVYYEPDLTGNLLPQSEIVDEESICDVVSLQAG